MIFEILLEELEEMHGSGERIKKVKQMRKFVNSILPVHKYKLMQRFLSRIEDLRRKIILNFLRIFLDERTTFFHFIPQSVADYKFMSSHSAIKSILKTISEFGPNIETLDLRSLFIDRSGEQREFQNFSEAIHQFEISSSENSYGVCNL